MNSKKIQPPITIPQKIAALMPLVRTSGNGIKIYSINCSDQEVIRFSFVFRAGTATQTVPFSASATANLLSEGTENYTAHQIAEELDFYGSYFDVSLDRDYSVITFCALSKFFEKTAGLATEILVRPQFHEEEIRTYCNKRKQRLTVERSKAPFKARELFSQSLYGTGHPYGISYHQDKYDLLTRDDITGFYSNAFVSENCFIVCSGRITEGELDRIETIAKLIPSGRRYMAENFPQAESKRFSFGAQEGAVQSSIRIGKVLFPRTHPDFIPVQVTASALGGYFGSRLIRNLREERGYTYGAFATVINMENSGYLAIATEVSGEVTVDAVKQIRNETLRLRQELIPEEELRMVRRIMLGEVMRILDGPFRIADVTIENIQNGTDNTYLDRFLETIRTITPEKVRETAVKHFDPEDFTTVIVGNRNVEKEMAEAGFGN